MCCLRDQTWLCVYCWCQTSESVVSPRRVIRRAQPLFKREFLRVPMTWRSLVREIQMWRGRCKQIDSHWFQGRQMRFWWMWSTISWKYFIIYQVRLFSTANISPEPSCIIFSTVYWLLLQPVNHRQQPVTSRLPWTCCGLVSTVFSRKTYFLCIDQNLF